MSKGNFWATTADAPNVVNEIDDPARGEVTRGIKWGSTEGLPKVLVDLKTANEDARAAAESATRGAQHPSGVQNPSGKTPG